MEKKYGLIVKKKDAPGPSFRKANVFGDDGDDEDDQKVDVSYSKTSASTIRTLKHAERQHEAAQAADPSIFDYDESYDQIQAVKNAKVAAQKEKDRERKSKYAENIMQAHKRREIERQSREERQQQKEREKEGEEFADKDVFVTGAYREQMELVQKFREEEAYEARFNDLTSVEKQKVWQAGLARQLLQDIARDGDDAAVKEIAKKEAKERNTRKRMDSGSHSEADEKEQKDQKDQKKSIYSDEEDGPGFNPPPKKNFEGGLRPGLNKVTKKEAVKAETKNERLRNRMFTPTPPSSDDEGGKKRERRRERTPEGKRREEKERAKEAREEKKKEEKQEPKKKLSPEEVKAQRLVRLKDILKQRNGPEQIEDFRQRYLERRAAGVVQPPL